MTRPAVAVVNLGCRVNRVESDRFITELSATGLDIKVEEEADLVVINTCAVTGEAEAKTRKAVRHALNLPKRPLVVATGCAVSLHADALSALDPRVLVEPLKAAVPRRACDALGARYGDDGQGAAGAATHERSLSSLLGRTRLGIKIQDGCNHRCSYCIVWKARGRERSVPVEDVLAEVRRAADQGVPEVVLTGVNLGRYSCGAEMRLEGLVERVLAETRIPQVRISSIEPMDVTDSLLSCMGAHADRVAPFLHLPLQSGCTATLSRMRRPYTAAGFLELVERIRAEVPAAALSCDVIVGFPGETDEEFEESLATCEQAGFSRMHVFRYSARPGTPAAAMPDQVPAPVMAARSARMRALANRMSAADALRRVGSVERAVIESGREGTLGSFHRVVVEGGGELEPGSLLDVAIMGVDERGRLHAVPA